MTVRRAIAGRTGRTPGDWRGNSRRSQFSSSASGRRVERQEPGRGAVGRFPRSLPALSIDLRVLGGSLRVPAGNPETWTTRWGMATVARSARPARSGSLGGDPGPLHLPVEHGDHDRDPAAAIIDELERQGRGREGDTPFDARGTRRTGDSRRRSTPGRPPRPSPDQGMTMLNAIASSVKPVRATHAF